MKRAFPAGLSWLVVVAVLSLLVSQALAAPAQVDTQVSRVALFKNGLAFIIRHGQLPAQTGPVQIGPLPAASHGTLWLSYDPAVSFANLASGPETSTDLRAAVSLPELLRANVGKKVRLLVGDKDSLAGVIKAYQRPTQPLPPSPYLADEVLPTPPPGGEVLLLQTDSGMVALAPGAVTRIIFLEAPALQIPQEDSRVALAGDLTQTGPNQALTVSYLSKGLTWAPSYVVDISDPKLAVLTAKAEILNEVEDLQGVSVDLVTGYPYLQFADILDPLAHKENLTAFLNSLSSGASSDRARRDYGAMTQQAMANGPAGASFGIDFSTTAPPPMPGYGAAAQGTTAEDLFLYPLEKVTLQKDHVGYYPLFSAKVAYAHVYEWEIPDYVNEQDNGYQDQQAQRALASAPQVVWHSLRLKNTTQVPWTTAPAETLLNGQILGQSLMPYTAAGGEALVKITQATNVHAEQAEVETNREVNALQRYGRDYDRITVEGKLLLHNYKTEAITVKVTKTVTGDVVSTTPDAKVDKLAKDLAAENPRSRLTWEVPLAAGADVEITYTYKVLIRR